MVVFYPTIPPKLATWALSQPVFFTASAPLAGQHVNISPKGLPSSTFTIFDESHAGYIDATGSGSETISHIYENGRVTIMFCSFGTSPRIMRLFCTGSVVEWDDPKFEETLKRMGKEKIDGARAVILLDVWKVCITDIVVYLMPRIFCCISKPALRPTANTHQRLKHPAATAFPNLQQAPPAAHQQTTPSPTTSLN